MNYPKFTLVMRHNSNKNLRMVFPQGELIAKQKFGFIHERRCGITRRASKYSPMRAVVVQWSHTRKRYERQGILVSAEAIECAEQESLADVDRRARQRERAALKREAENQEYIAAVAERLKVLFPGCPSQEAERIAHHACQKHSGRVDRSAAAKEFVLGASRLAVIAHIRHVHTRYVELLGRTGDRSLARATVQPQIERILMRWECVVSSETQAPLM